MLTIKEGELAVKLARESILSSFKGGKVELSKYEIGKLVEPGAAFVTVLSNRELRGCIGFIKPMEKLSIAISLASRGAAFEDPRFPPLTEEEFNNATIEVTILYGFREVRREKVLEELKIGKHGLIINKGIFSGVLLPQVAVEYCWDKETFLGETCIKASLSPDCWLDNKVKITIFSGQLFREKENGEVEEVDLAKEYSRCIGTLKD
jgi:AmmeMemoRadiSam system protein A